MIDLEACAIAGEMLRAAGFERRHTSMKSEATYYGLPDRDEVIRVAAHRSRRHERTEAPCVATITFNAKNFQNEVTGIVLISRAFVIRTVAAAIGNYMLRCAGVIRSPARYREYWPGGRNEIAAVESMECAPP